MTSMTTSIAPAAATLAATSGSLSMMFVSRPRAGSSTSSVLGCDASTTRI